MILALALTAAMAPAHSAETVGGKVACLSSEWLDDFVKFAVADDMASIQAYMDQQKCMVINDGLKVTVLEYPGMLGGQWLVSFRGTKFYVQREGIRDY